MANNKRDLSRNNEKKYQDMLAEIKTCVDDSYNYFSDNTKRFRSFREFVFKSTMSDGQKGALKKLKMPDVEFNIVEAFISRLRGEFARQQPGLKVQAIDGLPDFMIDKEFVQLMEVLEAHLQAIFFDSDKDKLEYDVYTDTLSGGFSVMKVFTEYVNEMSFEQIIKIDRPFSVTACGFDPLARKSHKGDGQYCFEMFPMLKDDFETRYGSALTSQMKFGQSSTAFSWSYRSNGKDIVVLCDFFKKKKRRVKVIKLVNGLSVTEEEYKAEEKRRENEYIPIQMVKKTDEWKWAEIDEIWRYRVCENQILEERKTNYKYLPLVFIDGNSIDLEKDDEIKQMTKPYIYNAKGIQMLKNAAGQALANELENMPAHKWVVAQESIPERHVGQYTNPQSSPVLIYKHFYDNNPEAVLPAPIAVPRPQIPPMIAETFRLSDDMTQMILGSYDAALGINDNELSGKAIANGAMQSNISSMPYIMGYLKGLNQVANIIIDLIPKYYRTPRTLPILKPDGTRAYYTVNKKDTIMIKDYDPSHLQVKVSAGINFAMQKQVALETIQLLMQSSQSFAEFINAKGMSVLLDNIEIRGIEDLKLKAKEWEEEKAQQQAQQAKMQQRIAELEMMKLEKEAGAPAATEVAAQKVQVDASVKAAEVEIKERESDIEFMKAIQEMRGKNIDDAIKQERIDAENMRTVVESSANMAETAIKASEHIHQMRQDLKENERADKEKEQKKDESEQK